jgi:glutamyl-tRNA synthetase
MAATFDLGRVSLGGPIFDLAKLRHFNGLYLRALTPEALYERAREWMLNDAAWLRIVPMAQPRLEQLTDLVPMSAFLFADRVGVDAAALVQHAGSGERACQLLRLVQWEIEKTDAWDADAIKGVFGRVAEKEDLKLKKLMPFFFLTFAGSEVSLPVYDAMLTVGRDMCLRRIQYALEALQAAGHALAGKGLKEFTAAYERNYGAKA